MRIRNKHSSSHPLSQKWKEKKTVSKAKEKLRDDRGITDKDKKSGVRELGWHATCTLNS